MAPRPAHHRNSSRRQQHTGSIWLDARHDGAGSGTNCVNHDWANHARYLYIRRGKVSRSVLSWGNNPEASDISTSPLGRNIRYIFTRRRICTDHTNGLITYCTIFITYSTTMLAIRTMPGLLMACTLLTTVLSYGLYPGATKEDWLSVARCRSHCLQQVSVIIQYFKKICTHGFDVFCFATIVMTFVAFLLIFSIFCLKLTAINRFAIPIVYHRPSVNNLLQNRIPIRYEFEYPFFKSFSLTNWTLW